MKHLPNALTVFRIVLTPVFLLLLLSSSQRGQVTAFGVFILLALSDWLDGKVARTYKVRSRLGRFLDPLADKILVLSTFAALPLIVPQIVPWWAVIAIAARDIVVTGLRTWSESSGHSIATLPVARAKTLVQLLFLAALLALITASKMPTPLGRTAETILLGPLPYAGLILVVLFTLYTGILYLIRLPYINTPAT